MAIDPASGLAALGAIFGSLEQQRAAGAKRAGQHYISDLYGLGIYRPGDGGGSQSQIPGTQLDDGYYDNKYNDSMGEAGLISSRSQRAMSGPVTYVQPDWDLDRQLQEKHFQELLRREQPPFPTQEAEDKAEDRLKETRERLAASRLEAEEKARKYLEQEQAATERLLKRQRAQRKLNNAQYRRQGRRLLFMEDWWLRFKIGLFGLFGVSAFEVIWDDRHKRRNYRPGGSMLEGGGPRPMDGRQGHRGTSSQGPN